MSIDLLIVCVYVVLYNDHLSVSGDIQFVVLVIVFSPLTLDTIC